MLKQIFILIFIFSVLFVFSYSGVKAAPLWKEYPMSDVGELDYPEDEGYHPPSTSPLNQLEWWYHKFHLTGLMTGHEYGIMVTWFTSGRGLPYGARTINITDVENNIYYTESLTEINIFPELNRWGITSANSKGGADYSQQFAGLPFQYLVHVDAAPGGTTLLIDSEKPPVPLGGTGLIQQTDSTWTYYYALMRQSVYGSITVNGFTEPVEGIGWIDRQWYAWNGLDADGYQWHAVQLDNGVDIEFYHVYDHCEDGTCVVQYPLMDIAPAGMTSWTEAITLTDEFTITRDAYWTSPETGKRYIKSFTVSHDDGPGGNPDFELHGTVLVDDQEEGTLYEGTCKITGYYEGEYVEGRSYLEQIINNGLNNWNTPIHVCSPCDGYTHCPCQ